MKIIHVDQGSEEWLSLRAGLPTASRFSDVITPSGGKSSSFDKTAYTLVAEKMMGVKAETFQSQWMKRGIELEPEARAAYEFLTDHEVEQVGLCIRDNDRAGASPDGLMADRGLEIKCPAPHTHVRYLEEARLPREYIAQVQGCMWVCERDMWDFVSYHPDMPMFKITIERDKEYINNLALLVEELHVRMHQIHNKVRGNTHE
jgi:putative phage-type endonuclease